MTEIFAATGMALTLSGLKAGRGELGAIADDTIKLPDYRCNPRVASRGEILDILKKSF